MVDRDSGAAELDRARRAARLRWNRRAAPAVERICKGATGGQALAGTADAGTEGAASFRRWAKEAIPPNIPEPRGLDVTIIDFVDANHAGNLANRRSHTGILIYVNNSPVLWYSKRQNTVETSFFWK